MNSDLHWNILDDERTAILPILKEVAGSDFYLAGGTGLALQLGHRDSIDFDFFVEKEFNVESHLADVERAFGAHRLTVTQMEKNTLSVLIDSTIQCSYMRYQYPQMRPWIQSTYFPIASVEDIGCMKLSAITSRSVEKDYIDLYFILKQIPLYELLSISTRKHHSLDQTLILKSLTYFDDVLREPILFTEGHDVSFAKVQESLQTHVKEYFSERTT